MVKCKGEDGEFWQLLGQAVGRFDTSRTRVAPAGQRNGKLIPHTKEGLCEGIQSPFGVMRAGDCQNVPGRGKRRGLCWLSKAQH